MWNEQRMDYPNHDIYRVKKSIKVFEKLGFKIIGTGSKSVLLSFTDEKRKLEDFMLPKADEGVLSKQITDILTKIGLLVAYFDFLYDNIE